MRTERSIFNSSVSMITGIATLIIGFIAQRIFIETLGVEYLGINGILTNIVMMLGLAELGIGSAIHFHLYKPLADNDRSKIKSLIKFYRSSYLYIATAIFVVGIMIIPFVNSVVGETSIEESIYAIYLLFLIDTLVSYLLTYKRSILYADQRNYIVSFVHFSCFMLMNITQIMVLIATKNYYVFLSLKIITRLLENVILNSITNKRYPYLKNNDINKLDSETRSDILKKVRGLAYHKVGAYVVLGTDNILISIFFGVATVGLLNSYQLVIGSLNTLIAQAYGSITSSVGNLLVNKNSSNSLEIYNLIRFGNFWLACLFSTAFFVTMNSFISLWIGEKFLLPYGVLLVLSVNFFFSIFKNSIYIFKEAAGIFYEDRHIPIVESTINLIMSIIFLKYFGLAGVFMGTLCGTLVIYLYSFPKYAYGPIFKQYLSRYYADFFKSFVIACLVGGITFAVSRAIHFNNSFVTFLVNILFCLLIPNAILFMLFRKSTEFEYYHGLVANALVSIKRRVSA